MRLARRLSVLGAAFAVVTATCTVGVASADTGSVTLAGVVAGGTYSGMVALSAVGDAGAGNLAGEIDFIVDGQNNDAEVCPDSVTACSATWTWDTSGLTGSHTVQTRLETDNDAVTPTSPLVTVTVVSPPPSAAITSPADGSQVAGGPVTVSGVGTVDASQSDSMLFATLLVDGQDWDDADCPSVLAKSCAVSFTWDTGDLVGTHTLQLQFETASGLTATSATAGVIVHVGTKSLLNPFSPLPYGHTAHLTGEVDSVDGSTSLAHVAVDVMVKPAVGKAFTHQVTTDGDGQWTLSYKAISNATVVATVAASASFGGSHASRKVQVYPTGKCTTKHAISAGARDAMTCTKLAPALKKGSKVQLQTFRSGKWHTFVTAKVSGAKFTVPFRLGTRGTTYLRVYVPATKQYVWSTSATFTVSVE
jgi:hypothetical protein